MNTCTGQVLNNIPSLTPSVPGEGPWPEPHRLSLGVDRPLGQLRTWRSPHNWETPASSFSRARSSVKPGHPIGAQLCPPGDKRSPGRERKGAARAVLEILADVKETKGGKPWWT